jgi:hypothetical protein
LLWAGFRAGYARRSTASWRAIEACLPRNIRSFDGSAGIFNVSFLPQRYLLYNCFYARNLLIVFLRLEPLWMFISYLTRSVQAVLPAGSFRMAKTIL